MILFYSIIRGGIAVLILNLLVVLVHGIGLLIDGPPKFKDSAPSMILCSLPLVLLSCWIWKIVTAQKRALIDRLHNHG